VEDKVIRAENDCILPNKRNTIAHRDHSNRLRRDGRAQKAAQRKLTLEAFQDIDEQIAAEISARKESQAVTKELRERRKLLLVTSGIPNQQHRVRKGKSAMIPEQLDTEDDVEKGFPNPTLDPRSTEQPNTEDDVETPPSGPTPDPEDLVCPDHETSNNLDPSIGPRDLLTLALAQEGAIVNDLLEYSTCGTGLHAGASLSLGIGNAEAGPSSGRPQRVRKAAVRFGEPASDHSSDQEATPKRARKKRSRK
jgi:hypothetical protein